MNLNGEKMEPCHEAPLFGFGGNAVPIEGMITLSVMLGKLPYLAEGPVKFYVVRIESPYNAIIGRPLLAAFQVVDSIPHLKIKLPTLPESKDDLNHNVRGLGERPKL